MGDNSWTAYAPLINWILQLVVVPGAIWVWSLHKRQNEHQVLLAVLKAEAEARERARVAAQEGIQSQLTQLVRMIEGLSSRIDSMIAKGSRQ